MTARSAAEIVDELLTLPAKTQARRCWRRKADNRKGEFRELFDEARKAGFARVRIDGLIQRLEDVTALDKKKKHTIELVIDRVSIDAGDRARLTDSVETARARAAAGSVLVAVEGETRERAYSEARACPTAASASPSCRRRRSRSTARSACASTATASARAWRWTPTCVVPDHEPVDRATAPSSRGATAIGTRRGLDRQHRRRRVARGSASSSTSRGRSLTPRQREVMLFGAGDKRVKVTWDGQTRRRLVGDALRGRRQHSSRSALQETVVASAMRQWYEPLLPRAARAARATASACARSRARCSLAGKSLVEVTGDDRRRGARALRQRWSSTGARAQIATEVLKEINARLGFLLDVGLDYLTLDRAAATLSGGEAQRIRLASQLGCELSGVMYVLDEPSIGLHQRDNLRLIATLRRLRDLGNTVLVVEHDEETIEAADHVVDFGPGAGPPRRPVVAEGTPDDAQGEPSVADRPLPVGQRAHRGARARAASRTGWLDA